MRRFTRVFAPSFSLSLMILASTAWIPSASAQGTPKATAPAAARNPRRVSDQVVVPAQGVADKAMSPEMESLLKLWEGQSRNLKSLDVAIYRIDIDRRKPPFGGEEHYQGTAKFETPNRAYIEFNAIKLDKDKRPVLKAGTNKRQVEPYEIIKCTGSEVWQYKFDSQQIFVYPLNKEEQARALDEGPLPFLFNMKADDARNRYHMTLLSNNNEQSKVHVIRVEPRLGIDREDFSEAIVELEKTYLLPIRIRLISPEGTGTREYHLSKHIANKPIDPARFKGVEYPSPWKVVRNPEGEGLKGKAAAAPRAAAPRRK